MSNRIGVEIKITSSTRESAIKLLKECIQEVENNTNSMYFPLNDEDNTEANISVVNLGGESIYDNWDECLTVVNPTGD
mgnify:CR=1 FL=1